jgi:hypothetical protein
MEPAKYARDDDPRRRLDEITASLADLRAQLPRRRAEADAIRVERTSRDHCLVVTVDARGELAALGFLGTRYRSAAPAELADLIVETVAAARQEAAERVARIFGPLIPAGVDTSDWGPAFAALRKPASD